MKKTILTLIILILIITIFTTTSFTGGIEDYYFIISIGLDKGTNKKLLLSLQISANSSNTSSEDSSSTQSSNFKIYSVEVDTIEQGLSILNNFFNKQINLSHCSTIIMSEELAKSDISEFISTLSNNTQLRHSAKIIISSGKSIDILNYVSNSGGTFSARLYDYLTTTTEYTGYTIDSTFGRFIQSLDSSKINPCAIYANVDTENKTIQSNGIAIFKTNHMVGHVDSISSIMHLLLTNKIKFAKLSISSPFEESEFIDIELSKYKRTKIDVTIINNTPYIEIDIHPQGSILASGSSFNYIENENIKILEEALNKYITVQTKKYLYRLSKEFNSDVIGMEKYFDKKHLTKDKSDSYNFKDVYKDSFYTVNVHSRIDSSNLFNKE